MMPVILAAIMCAVYTVLVTFVFRFRRGNYLRARFMVQLFFLTVPISIVLYYMVPGDVARTRPHWGVTNDLLDIGFFLFAYSSAFFGGILQLYNLTDRGLSLRMLIDVDLSAPDGLTADEVVKSYAAGKGICWMYQKRIDDLVRLKLIEVDGDQVELTAAGKRVAARFDSLRRFLRVTG